jgi:hypothetical protein
MGICILHGTLRLVNLNYVLCPALLIYTLVEVEVVGVGVDIAVGTEEIV